MERLVEMLGYKEDPMYEKIFKPILRDVTINSLDLALKKRDEVIGKIIEKAEGDVVSFPTFGQLVGWGYVEKIPGGFRTKKPLTIIDGLGETEGTASPVRIGSQLVHLEKDVTIIRSIVDSAVFFDEGSIAEYSTFPYDHNNGKSYAGPKSIISEAIDRGCIVSGNKNGKEKDTYFHPSMLNHVFIGYGSKISFGTVSLSHPVHDGNAPFIDPLNGETFDTGRRKNPSFIGTQRKFGSEVRYSKVGSNVTLHAPFAIGSGYAVDDNTVFYGIAYLEEENSVTVRAHHIKPDNGLNPMPFLNKELD